MLDRFRLRLLGKRWSDDVVVGRGSNAVGHLKIACYDRNGTGTIFFNIEKSLIRAPDKSLHLRGIRLQRSVAHENAALQLDQILLRKSYQLAKARLFRLESDRRRKHRCVDNPALEASEDRRHHAQAENGYVPTGIEAMLAQNFAQKRVRAAANAGHSDASALQGLDVANLRLCIKPKHRPIVCRK